MIEVVELRKRYAPKAPEAVAGISFEARRGEVFGLLGPNGAGKTTTIGALTTRVRPTSGYVAIDGIDVQADPVAVKQRIAVVPQRPNLDRQLKAIENLTFHAAYFGYGRARAAQARAGGHRRRSAWRAARTRTSTTSPAAWPSACSSHVRSCTARRSSSSTSPRPAWIRSRGSSSGTASRSCARRARRSCSTTHDMVEADRLCDNIAIVDHGTIVALDTPSGLRRAAPGRRRAWRSWRPAWRTPTVRSARSARSRSRDADGRRPVRIYGDGVDPAAVVDAVRGVGGEMLELRRLEGRLEDVFVHLTGRDLR